ncbi:hypothetical protein MCETOYE15_00056 [Candidatus Nanopelagicaceae bacterium]
MSTKTTFKRIALVAVAALGLGVLSVAPSQAGVTGLTVTTAAGTGSINLSDSTTAATITVSGLIDSGALNADSVTVAFITKDVSANSSAVARLSFMDTTSGSTIATPVLVSSAARGSYTAAKRTTKIADVDVFGNTIATSDSKTAGNAFVISAAGATQFGAKFALGLESTTTSVGTVGTYSYTVIVTSYNGATLIATQTADVNIVVSALADASKTPSATYTTAFIGTSSAPTADAIGIAGAATASATPVGYIRVALKNAANGAGTAQDTVTVTVTGPGNVSDSTTTGKSLSAFKTGNVDYTVLPDGTAGVATITITTSITGQSWTKTVTFYAKNAATITASVRSPIIKVGTNSGAVGVTAVDANGLNWTGKAYIVASSAADALIAGSDTPVECAAWNATDGIRCPISGVSAGTAKFKVIDAVSVATAKATSAEFSVTVSVATADKVKVEFDKATYAPFEKAIISVYPVDASGALLPSASYAGLLASGGITANQSFTGNSDTLTATEFMTASASSSSSGAMFGKKIFTVYMPAQGDVTISWTGGSLLPGANQVKGSTTVSVVNNAVDAATDAANEATDAANAATDAALAAADAADAATAAAQDASDAVAALSATVAKLVASLKAQITSLTNLVIKIQKKVKA